MKLTRLDSSIMPGLRLSTHQHPLMARYCPPASTRSETASSTSMFMVMAAVNKRSLNSHVKLIRLDSSITPGLGLSTHQHPLMAHYCPTAPTCSKTASSTSMFMVIAAVNKKPQFPCEAHSFGLIHNARVRAQLPPAPTNGPLLSISFNMLKNSIFNIHVHGYGSNKQKASIPM